LILVLPNSALLRFLKYLNLYLALPKWLPSAAKGLPTARREGEGSEEPSTFACEPDNVKINLLPWAELNKLNLEQLYDK